MIEVKDLTFSYGKGRQALHGLSFTVGDGEIFGFLGPNGSGKSTTQKILTGILKGYGGTVSLFGKDIGSAHGLICALLLKDFRQFTLAYLLIAIFAATPVFLSANTAVKLDWIRFHPFYHIYMGLKNAYFKTSTNSPVYYLGCLAAIAVLFAGVQRLFRTETGREG